jgi:hypothetical protein
VRSSNTSAPSSYRLLWRRALLGGLLLGVLVWLGLLVLMVFSVGAQSSPPDDIGDVLSFVFGAVLFGLPYLFVYPPAGLAVGAVVGLLGTLVIATARRRARG